MLTFKQFILKEESSSTISGDEVLDKLLALGTHGGIKKNSYLANEIKKQNFELKTVSISSLLQSDLDLKDYVDANKLRKVKGFANLEAPIIVGVFNGHDNNVMDGYNRILQHIKDKKSSIKAYVAVSK